MAEVPVKMALPAPRAERMSLLVARLIAVIVALMGGLILFAWQLTAPGLAETLPDLASMTPAAAVGITLTFIIFLISLGINKVAEAGGRT